MRIRRLAPEECHLIVQTEERPSDAHAALFPHHDDWKRGALSDVRHARRLALAAFFVWSSDSLSPDYVYAGSLILKPEPYSDGVEVKNLVVHEPAIKYYQTQLGDDRQERDSRQEREIRNDVRNRLIDAAEQFARRRGLRLLSVELPARSTSVIALFIERRYVVRSLREISSSGAYVYRLTKSLRVRYSGDPFDFAAAVEWLLSETHQPISLANAKRLSKSGTLPDALQLQFTIGARTAAEDIASTDVDDPEPSHQSSAIHADCVVVVDDEMPERRSFELIDQLRESSSDLQFFCIPTASERLAEYAMRNRTKLIDWKLLREDIGSKAVPPFDKASIAGLVIDVGPDTELLLRNRTSPFSYFVLSGVGAYLDTEQNDDLLALFSSPLLTASDQMTLDLGRGAPVGRREIEWVIWGYSQISAVQSLPFDQLNAIPLQTRLWSKAELDFHYRSFYVNQSPHRDIVVLDLSAPKILTTPVPIKSIATERILKYVLSDNEVSTCYVDSQTVSNFLGFASRHTDRTIRRPLEPLSRVAIEWVVLLRDDDSEARAFRRMVDGIEDATELPAMLEKLVALYSHGLRAPYDDGDRASFAARHAIRIWSVLSAIDDEGDDAPLAQDFKPKFESVFRTIEDR